MRRYGNQRRAAFEVEDDEGNEHLFATVQLLVASCVDDARVGCIGAEFEHYAQWKTVAGPDGSGSEADAARAFGTQRLDAQQRLVAGLLAPAHLLDVVRNFMLFMQVNGQTVKSACRYQQYRAVNRALARLRSGRTRLQHGEHDQRGGIVWHTQGSGKSLTMVFLVRKMRADAQLRRFKVIVVTDRKDLQRQLSGTAALAGEAVEVANSTAGVKALARRKGPGLIFATIQKYRDADTAGEAPLMADDVPKAEESRATYAVEAAFEVLDDDDGILVLVDEAHRTQAGDLHASLLAGLPNCARIGFTGTPIIMGEKKRTHEIFGEFIDRYTLKDAEADGATVPVLYEGRTAHGAIKDGASLDELFEDLFRHHTAEELEAIRKKYATKGHLFEAPALIADKARDIVRHYVANILPNGWKAQVVAYSRLAAVRYCRGAGAGPRRAARRSLRARPARPIAGRRGVVPAFAQGAGAGAGLALPRHPGAHRVRAGHFRQQQRRSGLEAVDGRRCARATDRALQEAAALCPVRPPGLEKPTRWPSWW